LHAFRASAPSELQSAKDLADAAAALLPPAPRAARGAAILGVEAAEET
jgi:hypothetical protein